MAKGVVNSYWLGGEESCPHCHFRYALAVERRCSACDGAACPHCITVVHETREVICRECELEDEGPDEPRSREKE